MIRRYDSSVVDIEKPVDDCACATTTFLVKFRAPLSVFVTPMCLRMMSTIVQSRLMKPLNAQVI